ncbi:MAG: C40 family peptidase [Longimicrobiaceae bacterium]
MLWVPAATAQLPEGRGGGGGTVSFEDAPTLQDSVVVLARAQLGSRYRFGGASPGEGFDCSGLVRYLMERVERRVPRTSRRQARAGMEIPRDIDRLSPGDVLVFGRGGRVTHVGLYVGDGRFIHASPGARRVVERPLGPTLGRLAWQGARRFLIGAPAPRLAVVSLPAVSRLRPLAATGEAGEAEKG